MTDKKIRSSTRTSVHRIELADGQLPDMACGVKEVTQETWFRPTHIDVEFDPKDVVEIRIYGPQVRRDGSLGQREMDHRWRR